ncbi:MAG: hypothetical protein DMF61_18815 [Blastocatellia bacterium AA13]|nr:MAG: hypothetical protein DMF61_18815 [Blastocatellia bacterium AA13]
MNLIALSFILAFALQAPATQKQNYPPVIVDSNDNRASAEREWRRLLDFYHIPQTPPDLYPLTYRLRSLLGVQGGIKIINLQPAANSTDIALLEGVKSFIDRWRDLIGADPSSISLVGVVASDGSKRITYRETLYSVPIVGGYGQLTIVLDAAGRLIQMDDRFIPLVDLPTQPAIDREVAARKLIGRSFSYRDISGATQQVKIGDRSDLTVKHLVVLPVEKGKGLEIHLAWEITAGKSLSWLVYVDAITGEELRSIQNFDT